MEEIIYNWILIEKETGTYIGWSKAINEPNCSGPNYMDWVEWGKELPDDIDGGGYKLIDGELVKDETDPV